MYQFPFFDRLERFIKDRTWAFWIWLLLIAISGLILGQSIRHHDILAFRYSLAVFIGIYIIGFWPVSYYEKRRRKEKPPC